MKYARVQPILGYDGTQMYVQRKRSPAEELAHRAWERTVLRPFYDQPNGPSGQQPQPPLRDIDLEVPLTNVAALRVLVVIHASPTAAEHDPSAGPTRAVLDPEEARRVGRLLDKLVAVMDDNWTPTVDVLALEDDWALLARTVVERYGPFFYKEAYWHLDSALTFTDEPPSPLPMQEHAEPAVLAEATV